MYIRSLGFICILWPLAVSAEVLHYKQWSTYCDEYVCSMVPRAHGNIVLTRRHDSNVWYFLGPASLNDLSVDNEVLDMSANPALLPKILKSGDWLMEDLEDLSGDRFVTSAWSLSGFTAGMLFADEHQGKTGQSALWARMVPDWNYMTDFKTRADIHECDDIPEEKDIHVYSLPQRPDMRLVGQICWMAAYNVGSQFWFVNAFGDVRPATAKGEYMDRQPSLDNADVETITTYSKGRGLGDCFTTATWVFDGTVYQLNHVLEDSNCDGRINPIYIEGSQIP